ncbi:cupin domain-containing protein [Siphonobacter sp. SORGH_AS_0500]|uniref:cupin domain-containing protein n=1 Tax=Siphonobacter sp. SORGH_AS_0500 TaxID=1864824 RepID=UPI001E2FC862|nr:cupin domain-containing protein [Siphonobacter sp. SORGH_AS_0500]
MEPELLYFKDDGVIPNNKLPVVIYRKVTEETGNRAAQWLEDRFASHDWTNSWRNGVYPFHHYHSTSHEVLGIYSGQAQLQLGGEKGQVLSVQAGDVLILPAGTGHKKIEASTDFGVVGAYPQGKDWDLLKGEKGERPQADQNIAALELPVKDPVYGDWRITPWQK